MAWDSYRQAPLLRSTCPLSCVVGTARCRGAGIEVGPDSSLDGRALDLVGEAPGVAVGGAAPGLGAGPLCDGVMGGELEGRAGTGREGVGRFCLARWLLGQASGLTRRAARCGAGSAAHQGLEDTADGALSCLVPVAQDGDLAPHGVVPQHPLERRGWLAALRPAGRPARFQNFRKISRREPRSSPTRLRRRPPAHRRGSCPSRTSRKKQRLLDRACRRNIVERFFGVRTRRRTLRQTLARLSPFVVHNFCGPQFAEN